MSLYQLQETRGDREVDRLFKILERATDLKASELDKAQTLSDIHLPKLSAELQVAESIADKLIKKRSNADESFKAKLQERTALRAVEWDTFVHDMTARCVKIDNNFVEKQEDIKEVFRKTEEKILKKLEEPGSGS